MTTLFPPVLESRAVAIPFSEPSGEENYSFNIQFFVPEIDGTTIALSPTAEGIKHIQVTLRYKDTGESAVNPAFSPDNATLFVPTYYEDGGFRYVEYDGDTRLCTVKVPYKAFKNRHPEKAVNYLVQVRFGAQTLWFDEDIDPFGGNSLSFSGYAVWLSNQTSTVPSNFGEWSNTQSVYCYGDAKTSLQYNFNDFIPELFYEYSPEENDPLAQCKVVYRYSDANGSIIKTIVVNGNAQGNGSYTARFKLPVAPVQVIYVSLEAVTVNGTVRGKVLNIPPLGQGLTARIPELADPWTMEDTPLRGEELEDGVVAKTLLPSSASFIAGSTISIYRANVFTLETTKIKEDIPLGTGSPIKFKDFSVEMGEDYQYIAIVKKNGIAIKQLVSIMPWGFANSGYARLMSLNSVFLDDKTHQLRVQGNVSISSFKRNTADQFQTTIGSKYPFYSRAAETNYRSFQLSGVITINCDPTGSFLKNDQVNGLRWEDDDESKLVILNRDLFGDIEYSMSKIRVGSNSMSKHEIIEYGLDQQDGVRGPSSIYDDYKARDIQLKIEPSRTDAMVFIERKFRDYAMKWLANGKAKLFRSETEGNMIVMPSAVSFSPLDKTGRIVYTVSMTLTEIAELNLENLIEYDLMPIEISTYSLRDFPSELNLHDVISWEDYNALIYLFPELKNNFMRIDDSYELINTAGVQFCLDKINEFSFIRGTPQSPIYDKMIFINSDEFNISKVDLADAKANGWTGPEFKQGVTFAEGHGHTYHFEKVTTLPDWLSFDTTNGVLSIAKDDTRPSEMGPRRLTFKVVDDDTSPQEEIYFTISTGPWYEPLTARPETDPPVLSARTTRDNIEYQIIAEKGVKFSDLSGNPNDLDYLFAAENLPFGLSMDPDGFIRGRIVGKQDTGGTIVVTVKDAVGSSVSVNVSYRQIFYWPYIHQADYFDVGYLEVNEDKGEISLIDAVVGGKGPFTFKVRGATTGREHILVDGVEIDGGKIKLKPDAGTDHATSQSFTIDLFDAGIPGGDAAASCTVILGPILQEFTFEDRSSAHVLSEIKGSLTSPISGNLPMIPIGQVLGEIDILNYMQGGSKVDFVTGGLPFVDEKGNKYYKFTAENLYPDYNISLKGKITGNARVSSPQREATLFVMDARGKKIALKDPAGVKTEKTTTIAEITSKLTWVGDKKPDLSLPRIVQGPLATGQTYEASFFVEDYLIGGYNPSGQTYVFEKEGTWPDWLDIKTENVVDPSTGTTKFKVTVYQVAGSSRTVSKAIAYTIKISDHSDMTTPQSTTMVVNVGEIVPTMVLVGGDTLTFTPSRMINAYSAATLPGSGLRIDGGTPPYTARATTTDPTKTMETSEYRIYQGQGAEQDPNNFYIAGVTKSDAELPYGMTITDGIGQTISLGLDGAAPAAELDYTTLVDDDSKTYLENKNLVVYMPDFLPEGSVIPEGIIIKGLNGFPGYNFLFKNQYQNEVIPGVTFYGAGTTSPARLPGTISGRPTRVNTSPNPMEAEFTVIDSVGNKKTSSDHLKRHIWMPPKVYDAPRYKTKGSLEVMAESIGVTMEGTSITCEPCFTGGIGAMKHPDVKYYYGYDSTPATILLEDKDPIIIIQDGVEINTGLVWNESATQLATPAGIALFGMVDIKIRAEIVANSNNLLSSDYNRIFTVHFEGIKEALMWEKYELPTRTRQNSIRWRVPVQTVPIPELDDYTWEIDLHDIPSVAKIVGGAGTLSFTLVEAPASPTSSWNLTTTGHLIHRYRAPSSGTPETNFQTVRVQVQDDFSIITATFEWQGVMSPLLLTLGSGYSPKIQNFDLSTGAMTGGIIIRDMSGDEFNIQVQGGSNNINNVRFSFVDSDPYGTPDTGLFNQESIGVLMFKSKNEDRAAIEMGTQCQLEKTRTLIAWDGVIDPERTAQIEKTIVIGAITGGVPLYPKTVGTILSIPEGAKETTQDITVNLNDYFDGSPAAFTMAISPDDVAYNQWTFLEGSITFEITGTNLTIKVVRPKATEEIPEMSFIVRLTLTSGNLTGSIKDITLPVGKVTV